MTIGAALVAALKQAATTLPHDVVNALQAARERETSSIGAAQLDAMLENVAVAHDDSIPMCQDTGIQTFFVEAGVNSPLLKDLKGEDELDVPSFLRRPLFSHRRQAITPSTKAINTPTST